MTDLLDNALVRRYFGCDSCKETEGQANWHRAFKVLAAMQEPLKKGEKYLTPCPDGTWIEWVYAFETCPGFHPNYLRLPSRFQPTDKKTHECNCEFCGSPETVVLGETTEERARRIAGKNKCECIYDCQKMNGQCQHPECKPTPEKPILFNCTGWCPKCNNKITYSGKCPDCDKKEETDTIDAMRYVYQHGPGGCECRDASKCKCDCHKPSQPEKCECDKLICDYCVALGGGPTKPSDYEKCCVVCVESEHMDKCPCHDSDKAVEAKIRKIRDWVIAMLNLPYNHVGVEAELRELVKLAQGGGKR